MNETKNNLYIKQIDYQIKSKIKNKLYYTVNIVGEKTLSNSGKVHIIELEDYTRVWILPEELGKK